MTLQEYPMPYFKISLLGCNQEARSLTSTPRFQTLVVEASHEAIARHLAAENAACAAPRNSMKRFEQNVWLDGKMSKCEVIETPKRQTQFKSNGEDIARHHISQLECIWPDGAKARMIWWPCYDGEQY
jgi:hypothetical protein